MLANVAALYGSDPELARLIDRTLDVAAYPVEASKAGPATLALPDSAGGRIYLHSRHQPMEEARRLIDAADLEGKALFCVQGFGLGYHVEQLFDRISPEAIIVVFEPDLRMLRTAFDCRDYSRLIRSGRLLFITAAERAPIMLKLGSRQALVSMGLTFVAHPPSLRLNPSFHAQVQAAMADFLAYCRTSLNTVLLNSRRTCENIARNLSFYASSPGINSLRNRHFGVPAIIVSAGPSLRKNKHLLKGAQSKAILIAVQTALQPLVEMGIEPDYVTSLDYHDICTRFFERLPRDLRTILVAEPKASTAVLELYPGPLHMLGNEFADQLLGDLKLQKDRLRAGATVAHLAFYLAEYLGCDPVIFVGQDLAFSDGLSYTPGTSYEDVWRPELNRFCTVEMKQWEHIARERPILRVIEDYQGNPIYTEERLFTYLQQFERDFAVTRCRVIDATEGGARKRGAASIPLAEVLASLGARPAPSQSQSVVGERHQGGDLLPVVVEALGRRLDECREIQRISRDTLSLLRELGGCLDDQRRSNRIIAQIDALHSRINALNDCYELVCHLSQQTELDRFRADHQLAASRLSGIERQRRQLDRDIRNVQAVIVACEEFQRLISGVQSRMSEGSSIKRRTQAA